MSRLTIHEAAGGQVFRTEDAAAIAAELETIGAEFARWESPITLDDQATPEAILAAYRPYLDALMGAKGAGSADVIALTPDLPDAAALRRKFLSEHIHTEDEIRFFVSGCGHFVMHQDGKVYDAFCEAGDLIAVPAGLKHWFDAGPTPRFTALRVFTDTAGWVAHFTGDDISSRFALG